MSSMIDVRDFDPRFKTGLIFSIYEGLKEGLSFKILCDQEPNSIMNKFAEAKVTAVKFVFQQKGPDLWEINIAKKSSHQTQECCGICGGRE